MAEKVPVLRHILTNAELQESLGIRTWMFTVPDNVKDIKICSSTKSINGSFSSEGSSNYSPEKHRTLLLSIRPENDGWLLTYKFDGEREITQRERFYNQLKPGKEQLKTHGFSSKSVFSGKDLEIKNGEITLFSKTEFMTPWVENGDGSRSTDSEKNTEFGTQHIFLKLIK